LDTGSFSGAARPRHLSPPALLAQVKAPEAELGVALFTPPRPGVVPTAARPAPRPRVRSAPGDGAGPRAWATEIREGGAAPPRIGCAASHVSFFLADCIERLRRSHPEAPFPSIVAVSSATGSAALERGEIDLLVEPWTAAAETRGFPLYP